MRFNAFVKRHSLTVWSHPSNRRLQAFSIEYFPPVFSVAAAIVCPLPYSLLRRLSLPRRLNARMTDQLGCGFSK